MTSSDMESVPSEPDQESDEDDLADLEVFAPLEEPEDPSVALLEPPPVEPPLRSVELPLRSVEPPLRSVELPLPSVEPPLRSDELFSPLDFSAESLPDVFFSEEAASLSEEAAFL